MPIARDLARALWKNYVPVVVKARPRRFSEILETIADHHLGRLARKEFFAEYLVDIYARVKKIPRLLMIEAILPSWFVESLGRDPGVEKVYMSRLYKTNLVKGEPVVTTADTAGLIGARKAWEAGYCGRGVTVGVVDSGVFIYHEQLGLRGKKFEYDSVHPVLRAETVGHGTHVATTILGRKGVGKIVNANMVGTHIGMAPCAKLVAIKALFTPAGVGSTGDIAKAVVQAIDKGARIVNLSLGSDSTPDTPEDDPFTEVARYAEEKNAVLVAAAGNSGPDPGTINSPAWLPGIVAVAAVYPAHPRDAAFFSSRGPTKDGRVKPDVAAPGVNISSGTVGLMAGGRYGPKVYAAASGTSMATPHVSGLLALMAELYAAKRLPWGPREVWNLIKSLNVEKNNDVGYGLLTWDRIVEYVSSMHGVEP